jgi:hypothetical protein
MHSAAQTARIGPGTVPPLPTREELVLAVYHADVERLVAAAASLSAAQPSRDAMRHWLAELAAYGRVKQSVSRSCSPRVHAVRSHSGGARWYPTSERLDLGLAGVTLEQESRDRRSSRSRRCVAVAPRKHLEIRGQQTPALEAAPRSAQI